MRLSFLVVGGYSAKRQMEEKRRQAAALHMAPTPRFL
jgi:hypothetical protein